MVADVQKPNLARGEGEKGESLSKEDLFYYIYGPLQFPDYRSRFADNRGKELPLTVNRFHPENTYDGRLIGFFKTCLDPVTPGGIPSRRFPRVSARFPTPS